MSPWQCITNRAAPVRRGVKCVGLLVALLGAARAHGQTSVSVDLGATNAANGITCPSTGDGDNTPATMGGVDCRRNLEPIGDFYMYFNVADSWAFQGNKPRVDVTINYYDSGTGSLELHYDATGNPYNYGGAVALTNTNTWKQYTYQVSDAYFGNRENYTSDFRISGCCSGITFYLDVVQVAVPTGPAAPMIAAVSSPDPATVGTAYTKQLVLIQGNPTPTWTLLQGPAGAQVSSTGRVSGWTPSPCEMGSLLTFQVKAENTLGSDTATWQASIQFSSTGNGLVLNDPLDGSTIAPSTGGGGQGGTFLPGGGWRVRSIAAGDSQNGPYDCIFWHVPPTPSGAFEYDVRNIGPNNIDDNGVTPYDGSNELSCMYDWTSNNSDYQYSPGFQGNPFKEYIRKQGGDRLTTLECIWCFAVGGCAASEDTGTMEWKPADTYHFRVEWESDKPAEGQTQLRIKRTDATLLTQDVPGPFSPGGWSVRIGASTRHYGEDASLGAVYSNVRVWDSLQVALPPVIHSITPNPGVAWCGYEYTKQLVAQQGNPAPGWCLLQGPSGAQINAANGLVTGWVPAYEQLGQLMTFVAKAANSAGADTKSWQVLVKAKGDLDLDGDSDQGDFGILQACLSGTGIALRAGCEDGDLAVDGCVDGVDVEAFRRCFGGPNVPVQPHCAD